MTEQEIERGLRDAIGGRIYWVPRRSRSGSSPADWGFEMANLLHQLLSDAAGRDPHREAVRCAGRSLTYAELDAASNAIAGALIQAGVRRGDRVAIYMTKRVEVVACVYGVLKAGAAYVPLDPKAPIARVALVANDCAVAALLDADARSEVGR